MSNKDLLDILYSERARLKDIYILPGWTEWAIIVAISGVIWMLFPYLEGKEYCVTNVCLLTCCWLNGVILFSIPKAMRTRGRAVWKKGGQMNRIGAIAFGLFFSVEIIFIFNTDCVIKNAMAIMAVISLSILILCYIGVFIMSFFPSIITPKNNKFSWIWYFFLAPVVAVLVAALVRSWGDITWIDFKMSILIVVIAFLFLMCFCIIQPKHLLSNIDALIEDTLMSDNINEHDVLKKLDEIVGGLRVGDFLYQENMAFFVRNKKSLTDNLVNLKKATEQNDQVLANKFIVDSSRKVSYVINVAEYNLKMIQLAYGKQLDYKDRGLGMLIDLLHECIRLSSIWLAIAKKQSDGEDYNVYLNNVNAKFE